MWKLVIEDDEGKRTVVPLSRDDYTIGRQEGNTIRLTERNISRQHGRVRKKSGGNGALKDLFSIEDRQSYNGVFVNGLRVATAQDLQHGDLIQIGDYRIILQDDAADAAEAAVVPVVSAESDPKATLPMAQAAQRGSLLMERPNRLVMLVGPTPGVEYPLDVERLTIGRAEEATISVNHNSVSRLHCEVHALGDGRFEIVDKGSSNGVRVNSVDLRRTLIEAGDLIELGDVRFRFVGAGQVFVAGPNESQQLTAISDRDAELAERRVPASRTSVGGFTLPIIGAGLAGAVIIIGLVFMLRSRDTDPTPPPGSITTSAADAEQATLAEARLACTPTDCEASHQKATTALRPDSPWRESADFKFIEATWADSLLAQAQAAAELDKKKALLARVAATTTVDTARRNLANDRLAQLDTVPVAPTDSAPQPSASSVDPTPTDTAPPTTTGPTARVTPPPPTTKPTGTPPTPATTTAPPATTTAPKPATRSDYERAMEAAKAGNTAQVRNILEVKVRSGRASNDEALLVFGACKAARDTKCWEDVKAKYPSIRR